MMSEVSSRRSPPATAHQLLHLPMVWLVLDTAVFQPSAVKHVKSGLFAALEAHACKSGQTLIKLKSRRGHWTTWSNAGQTRLAAPNSRPHLAMNPLWLLSMLVCAVHIAVTV